MSKHDVSEAQHANKEHYTDIKHKETIMASNTRWRRNRSATEHKNMMTPTTMMEAGNIQTTKMLMSTWTWNPKRLLVTIVQPKQAQTSMTNRASSKHVTSEIRRLGVLEGVEHLTVTLCAGEHRLNRSEHRTKLVPTMFTDPSQVCLKS